MKLTKPQLTSLLEKWQINAQSLSFLKFRRTVAPMIADDAAVVHWSNMWLVIEADGHVHT